MSLKFEVDRGEVDSEENIKKLERGQKWVFMSTFLNYAYAHWTRKCYTNVKVQLMAAGVDPLTLTAMDSGFMVRPRLRVGLQYRSLLNPSLLYLHRTLIPSSSCLVIPHYNYCCCYNVARCYYHPTIAVLPHSQ